MKIYIISNVSDEAERFSDALENIGASIILKEVNTDAKGLVTPVTNAAASGSMVVVVTDDPISASMLLNKQKNIDAALCNSEKDIPKAKQINANVIVVGSDFTRPERLSALFTGTQKESKPRDRPEPARQKEAAPKPSGPGIGSSLGGIFAKKPTAEKPKKRAEPEEEDEEPDMPQARKGILGKIKDSLGIVDEK